MGRPANYFTTLAGVPVHYNRITPGAYRTRGVATKFYCQPAFETLLDRVFADVWDFSGKGPAEVITSAGAYTDKAGYHGRGLALDIDGIHWADRVWITDDYPTDASFYLAVAACVLRHIGLALTYLYNADHHDHIHCDTSQTVALHTGSRSQTLFTQAALKVVWGKPIAADGAWGSKTGAAFAEVCNSLGLSSPASNVEEWRAFLKQTALRGFGRAAVPTTPPVEEPLDPQPTNPLEALALAYKAVQSNTGEAVEEVILGRLNSFRFAPETVEFLAAWGDRPAPEQIANRGGNPLQRLRAVYDRTQAYVAGPSQRQILHALNAFRQRADVATFLEPWEVTPSE